MRKFLTKEMIVLMLGLVLSASTVIATGQDSEGKVGAGTEGIISNTSYPEIIPGTYSLLRQQQISELFLKNTCEELVHCINALLEIKYSTDTKKD